MSSFDDILVMQSGLRAMEDDPMALFHTTSDDQRRFLRELGLGEIYLHAGNKWGKTTIGARAGIAMARGLKELDGVPLPALPVPNVGVVGSLDFKQQRLSVQPKYLEAVGNWPHKYEWNGQTLQSIRIKPDNVSSMDPRDWSLIIFISAENRRSGTGFRGNWLHFDEPPPEGLWRELRKMGEAGALFVRYITATSLKRSQWYWLRKDYPIEYEGKWHGKYLRLRAPAFDPDDPKVGNQALTQADKEELMAIYETDPLKVARITGKEIDTSGTSPFRQIYEELGNWATNAKDGHFKQIKVDREVPTEHGKELVIEYVDCEFWEKVDPACVYRVIIDPSLGIDDGEHDPTLVEIFNMTKRTQVMRYSGYLGEFGAGVLAGRMSHQFNGALVDIAKTGGYGSAVMSGLRVAKCRNIFTIKKKSRRNRVDRVDIGFSETTDTRPEYAAAIVEALKASRAGHPYMKIRSRADIFELMDLQFDNRGKIIEGDGSHDEAFAVIGRFATLVTPDKRSRHINPSRQRPGKSPIEMVYEMSGQSRETRSSNYIPRPAIPRVLTRR